MEINIGDFLVKIDSNDWPKLSGFDWRPHCPHVHTYFRCRVNVGGKRKPIYLHRMIMNIYDPKITVDHINGDTTDNRKENLRLCTQGENSRNQRLAIDNTTGFKGVSRKGKKFAAQIRINYKNHWLGVFNTAEEAHAVYCEKAKELHGEFARFR